MPTPVLTRLLHEAVEHQAPKRAGAVRPKLRYAHQGGMNPPIVVIHGNALDHVTDAYKRYLEGRFRDHFKLVGTPLRIEMRSLANPFDDNAAADDDASLPAVDAAGPCACRERGIRCDNVAPCWNSQHGAYREQQRATSTRPFLNLLRKEHVPVSIYLVNGIKLQGHIESFDQYVVLLRNTVTQMVYKHAISTVVPGRARQLPRQRDTRRGLSGALHLAAHSQPARGLPLDRTSNLSAADEAAAIARRAGGRRRGRRVIRSTRRSTNWRCWPSRPATSRWRA